MTTKLFLFILFFLSSQFIFSQDIHTKKKSKSIIHTFSYFGNYPLKPGLKYGADIILSEKINHKTITKKDSTQKIKLRTNQLLLGGNIGFYYHPRSHTGIFNYYELTYKRIYTKGFQYLLGIGPGLYRSVYPTTYEIDDNNNINKIAFPGRTYFTTVFVLGFGREYINRKIKSTHLKFNTMILYNYNADIMPLFNIEIGFCF